MKSSNVSELDHKGCKILGSPTENYKLSSSSLFIFFLLQAIDSERMLQQYEESWILSVVRGRKFVKGIVSPRWGNCTISLPHNEWFIIKYACSTIKFNGMWFMNWVSSLISSQFPVITLSWRGYPMTFYNTRRWGTGKITQLTQTNEVKIWPKIA